MPDPTNSLLGQLGMLLRLTQTEAQTAQVRRSQARTEAVEQELRENAEHAEERTRLIAQAIRDLGGVPDVIGGALGRVAALVKVPLEQATTLPEALLSDLALEHQLLDRTRYVRALAQAAGKQQVLPLVERLEAAHTETIEWLTTTLAEVALGGPAKLRATPAQAAVGFAVGAVGAPARLIGRGVNRLIDRADDIADTVAEQAPKVAQGVGEAVAAGVASGREATLQRAEEIAREQQADEVAETVRDARRDAGALSAEELPVQGYDAMNLHDAVEAVRKLETAEDVRAVIAYEEAHKNRAGVVSAAQARLTKIAGDLVDAG